MENYRDVLTCQIMMTLVMYSYLASITGIYQRDIEIYIYNLPILKELMFIVSLLIAYIITDKMPKYLK